jgi:hypothetical protein
MEYSRGSVAAAGSRACARRRAPKTQGRSLGHPRAKRRTTRGQEKAANDQLKNLPGCTTVIKDAGDGKFVSASNCTVNGTLVVSNGFTTFVSKKITHSETQAKYTPPFRGKSDESMIQDQQYVGNCPSGLKAGDTIGPDGLIRHRN